MKIEKTSGSKYAWTKDNLWVSVQDLDLRDTLLAGIFKAKTTSTLDMIWSWAEMYTIDEEMDINRCNWFLYYIDNAIDEQKKKINSIMN